jgi:alkanesulfonate monooxygenase SsuD/methylene tetrahydromethanopterin reductase-like flavin-dependent oxidoreductase (luciferase family)
MARLLALAPTKAEAAEIAHRGAQWLVDAYAGPQHAHRKSMQMARTYDGKDPAQHYVDSVILHGTPGAVIDQIAALKDEIGLNYLMCAPLSRETFRLLAEQVAPRL